MTTEPFTGTAAVEFDYAGSAGWVPLIPALGDCTTQAGGILPHVLADTVSAEGDATSFTATDPSAYRVGDRVTGLDTGGDPYEVVVSGIAGAVITHAAAGAGFTGDVRILQQRWGVHAVASQADIEVRLHDGAPDPSAIGHKIGTLDCAQMGNTAPPGRLWLKGSAGRISLTMRRLG